MSKVLISCMSRVGWQMQSLRMAILCGALLGSSPSTGGADLLLYLAAARLLSILTDSSQWKCFRPGDAPSFSGGKSCKF